MLIESNDKTKTLGLCVAIISKHFPIEKCDNENIASMVVQKSILLEFESSNCLGVENFSIIKMRSSKNNAISVKPFNIIVNWKLLVKSAPEMALTIFGVTENIWMFVLAAIVLVLKLENIAEIKLTEYHAILIIQIVDNNGITVIDLEKMFLERLKKQQINNINEIFKECFCDLEKMKIIKTVNDRVNIIEKIQIS